MAFDPQEDFIGPAGIARGRQALRDGQIIVYYFVSPATAEADPALREAIGERALASMRLARDAGLFVTVKAQEWENGEIFWSAKVFDFNDVSPEIQLMAWDEPDRALAYTLTRATQHGGWRLTRWASDGAPWGHADIMAFEDAFDSSPMASGTSLEGLRQVQFRDGTTLVRAGSKALENPARRRGSKLLRGL